MKVIVAGATGAVGRPLVRVLRESGHEVIGITRTSAGAAALSTLGATAVIADALNRDSLLTAFAGQSADAVINELTALTKAPARYADMEPTNVLRQDGSANLVEVARLVGAKRFLTQSIFFGYGYRDFGSTVITEDAPFGSPQGDRTDPVLAALVAAEAHAQSLPGVVGIALRYGLFYGGDVTTTSGCCDGARCRCRRVTVGRSRSSITTMQQRRPLQRWRGAPPAHTTSSMIAPRPGGSSSRASPLRGTRPGRSRCPDGRCARQPHMPER